jgi:hypothetical protein
MSVIYNKKKFKAKRDWEGLTLDLSGKKITQISSIEGLEDLHELAFLNLSNNQISEIEGLERLRNLKGLNLANNSITEIKNLKYLTNLEYLNLNENPIYILKGLDTLENLKVIHLFKCKISEIESFSNKPSLEILFLGKNPIYSQFSKVVKKRKKLHKMTEEQRNQKNIDPKLYQIAANTHFKLKYRKKENGIRSGSTIVECFIGLLIVIVFAVLVLIAQGGFL